MRRTMDAGGERNRKKIGFHFSSKSNSVFFSDFKPSASLGSGMMWWLMHFDWDSLALYEKRVKTSSSVLLLLFGCRHMRRYLWRMERCVFSIRHQDTIACRCWKIAVEWSRQMYQIDRTRSDSIEKSRRRRLNVLEEYWKMKSPEQWQWKNYLFSRRHRQMQSSVLYSSLQHFACVVFSLNNEKKIFQDDDVVCALWKLVAASKEDAEISFSVRCAIQTNIRNPDRPTSDWKDSKDPSTCT